MFASFEEYNTEHKASIIDGKQPRKNDIFLMLNISQNNTIGSWGFEWLKGHNSAQLLAWGKS